jgi:hypothetical protein
MYVICAEEMRHTVLYSENLDIGGRVTLQWILEKEGGKLWTGFI